MKLSHLLLAAGLFSFSAAAAQNAPGSATQTNNSNPAVVPSGMAPPASDPRGAVTPGQVFTKGAPTGDTKTKHMKHKKMKDDMYDDKGKMKTKM